MQVEWETIEAIAATKAIDLWLLCVNCLGRQSNARPSRPLIVISAMAGFVGIFAAGQVAYVLAVDHEDDHLG